MSELVHLQSDFQLYLLGHDRRIVEKIAGGEGVDPEERLGIYFDAYRLRLLEAMEADFIALRALTGDEIFDAIGRAYIDQHPSTHFSIRYYGHRLAEFLSSTEPYDKQPWLAETAAFEWALTEAFDAANSPLVTPEDMAKIAPGAWPSMRLIPHASVRRLDLRWNIPAVWKAVKAGKTPPELEESDPPAAWLLWRQDLDTFYRKLDVTEAWGIDALLSSRTFADICAGLCEWIDEQNAAAHAAGLLKRWIIDGLISAVDTPRH